MTGSFEHIAAWWDEAVGKEGDDFHQHFIRPALYRVLGDVAGRAVLDLGCGNGSSTRPLARAGAHVTGVDVSSTLIERARGYEADDLLGIEYLVVDATEVPLPDASFDLVACNMALMDINDGEGTIREISRLLKPGGRFAASLFHPCFQIAEGSSWMIEIHDFDQQISRRVWRYMDVFDVAGVAKSDQPVPHTYYHRPLNWYARRLAGAGLLIDTLDEPVPDETFAAERPESFERLATIPFLLVIGARKIT